MQRLLFVIIYPILWLFSKLPFFILHRISDIVFLFLYYIFNYRKEIVLNNLKLAFPKKNKRELLSIRRKFFRHFTDIFIEMTKSFTISEKEISKRYKYKNPEIFEEIEKLGKSVIIMGSHYANWEWIVNLSSITNLNCIGVYKKISNPYFDKALRENRERFGGHFIETRNTVKKMVLNKQNNTPSIYGLLSDQSPTLRRTQYWRDFLNVKVPIHTGAELLAKKYDFLILHMTVNRVKRSYYEVDFEILAKNPRDFKDFEITDGFIKRTEKQIKEKPQYYFWTHKRFKHKDRAPK
ncbi:lysophospholipid acyltransferase family protein [Flavicella sp.]|uniref:lysophospholipid acyltransferase family protein n=1 Tax=Flavicella sp. TaxID=2957742 RepID=UPI00301B5AD1